MWGWGGCRLNKSRRRMRSSHAANMSHLDWHTHIISDLDGASKWASSQSLRETRSTRSPLKTSDMKELKHVLIRHWRLRSGPLTRGFIHEATCRIAVHGSSPYVWPSSLTSTPSRVSLPECLPQVEACDHHGSASSAAMHFTARAALWAFAGAGSPFVRIFVSTV